jgi:hypothetical protein
MKLPFLSWHLSHNKSAYSVLVKCLPPVRLMSHSTPLSFTQSIQTHSVTTPETYFLNNLCTGQHLTGASLSSGLSTSQ